MSRTIYYPPAGGGGGSADPAAFSVLKPVGDALSALYYPTLGAGHLLAVAVDVPSDSTLQAIQWRSGSNSSGNYRVGVYGPAPARNNPDSAPRLVDSGQLACPSTFSRARATFSNTPIAAGQCWVVFTFSNGSQTFQRNTEEFLADTGFFGYAAAAFAALPATLPDMSTDDNAAPFFYMEVTPA